MDGVRLNDSEALKTFGIDKQKLVEEITRAYAHQIYIDGFFNGDPHPGTLSFLLNCFFLNLFHCFGFLFELQPHSYKVIIVNFLPSGLFIYSTF